MLTYSFNSSEAMTSYYGLLQGRCQSFKSNYTNSLNSSRFITFAPSTNWPLKRVTTGLYSLNSIALKKDIAMEK